MRAVKVKGTILSVNPGSHFSQGGIFRPEGDLLAHSEKKIRMNPVRYTAETTLSARLFVGFNVNEKPIFEMDDLIDFVFEVRKKTGHPEATFLSQRGIYKHKVSDRLVSEDGAQIIIIATWETTFKEFEADMIALAEKIAAEFEQEEVLVEIQKNGVTDKIMGVYA